MTKGILVAGAEGFLGQAAVRFLCRQGMRVAASCRTSEDASKVKQMLESQGLRGVEVVTCNLADESAVVSMISQLENRMGPLCGLFNAAGGFRWGYTDQLSSDDFDFLVTANLRSSWLLAKTLVPRFKAQGFGRMVFVSAKSTLAPSGAGMSLYSATKAGINALVESLAIELKGSGVTVNAVMPSIIDTPANRQAMPEAIWSEWVTTDEVMQAAWTFLGPEGGPFNGALLPVTGRV